MDKLLLQVFLSPFSKEDDQPTELLYEYRCRIPENFVEIQRELLICLGEGFRAESNQIGDNCFLTVYLLWERSLESLKSYFEQFEPVDEWNPISVFAAQEEEYVIQVDAEFLSADDLEALERLLAEENIPGDVLQAKQISEWGASGYFDQLMVKLSVDLTKEVIFALVKKIKKLFKHETVNEVLVINIRQEVKTELLLEYGLKVDEIYLSSFRRYEDNSQYLVYKSNLHTYSVRIDKDGRIEAIKRK